MKLERDKIRVLTEDVGGGFGLKSTAYPELPVLLIAAKKARPARALDGGPLGIVRERQSRARRLQRRGTRARRERQVPGASHPSSRRHGRLCRLSRRAHRHQQSRALPAGHVRHRENRRDGEMRLHQHGADRRLSRRRTAGGELRAGTARRRSGARGEYRSRRDQTAEFHPAGAYALQNAGRHRLRQRRVRSPPRQGIAGERLCRVRAATRERQGEAALSRHRHFLLPRTRRRHTDGRCGTPLPAG